MTTEELQRIAELARLSFTPDELTQFAQQFENIISYVSVINAADLGAVEPQAHVNDAVNITRPDVVGDCLTTEQALSNAPKKNEAFFKVPKVLGS